jgi:hypothetical protein
LDFFRIRPELEWTFPTGLLDMGRGEDEKYVVAPNLLSEVVETGRFKPVVLYMGITFNGVLFLSDIPTPGEDGKDNEYHRSRRIIYELGKTRWVKMQVNKDLGAYEAFEAKSMLPDPVWPEEPADIIKALEICFKNNYIDSVDHAVLKELRGEL